MLTNHHFQLIHKLIKTYLPSPLNFSCSHLIDYINNNFSIARSLKNRLVKFLVKFLYELFIVDDQFFFLTTNIQPAVNH